MTQAALAEHVGVSPSTVAMIEASYRRPPPGLADQLVAVLLLEGPDAELVMSNSRATMTPECQARLDDRNAAIGALLAEMRRMFGGSR